MAIGSTMGGAPIFEWPTRAAFAQSPTPHPPPGSPPQPPPNPDLPPPVVEPPDPVPVPPVEPPAPPVTDPPPGAPGNGTTRVWPDQSFRSVYSFDSTLSTMSPAIDEQRLS
jgi:hypothetical protein